MSYCCLTGEDLTHLVQVGVPGDVIPPFLGVHAALVARAVVADPHSLRAVRGGPVCCGMSRGGGGHPHPASAQQKSGSSLEGVHAACRPPMRKHNTRELV